MAVVIPDSGDLFPRSTLTRTPSVDYSRGGGPVGRPGEMTQVDESSTPSPMSSTPTEVEPLSTVPARLRVSLPAWRPGSERALRAQASLIEEQEVRQVDLGQTFHEGCSAPWDGFTVHQSGDVFVCDMISHGEFGRTLFLGNLHEQSITEILEGPRLEEIRGKHLTGSVDDLACSHCDKFGSCNVYQHGVPMDRETRQPIFKVKRLELGITDLCNMRCIMCPLAEGEHNPPGSAEKGFLPFEQIERLMEELEPHFAPEVVVWPH